MDYSRFAHLYDGLVTFDEDLVFFVEETKGSSGLVLELMAGTGRVTASLVASGVCPICVDSSPAMLARLTRKLGHRAALPVCADVRKLPFDSAFALALLPFNALSEVVLDADRRIALEAIHAALAPRGRFVCTFHNPAVRLRSVTGKPQRLAEFPNPSGPGEVSVTAELEFQPDRGVVTGVETFTTRLGDEVTDEIAVPIEFCLPSRSWIGEAVSSAGFAVEALYGDYDRSRFRESQSRFMIWCLRKGVTRPATGLTGDRPGL